MSIESSYEALEDAGGSWLEFGILIMIWIAQPRTYPQLPLSFANGQLFGGAL